MAIQPRMLAMSAALCCLALPSISHSEIVENDRRNLAQSVTITILSSNLADGGTIGEWGFAALIEVDGHCLLFDTGRYPDTVMRNAAVLDVDLSCVTDVVLSHFHFDHTSGLIPLVDERGDGEPARLKRVHVADGFFLPRRLRGQVEETEGNQMIASRERLEAAGVEFVVHSRPTEIAPAIWVSGPVVRNHPEKNYPQKMMVRIEGEWVEDHVPDSQGLAVATEAGSIVLLGCGHSGTVNLLEQIQRTISDQPVHALMGGMHLFNASDQTLEWTAQHLLGIGVEHLMAGHCTGIEPLMRLRSGLNLNRKTAVVGAVGSKFVYGEGIHATAIAQ